jgi:hypothetical protein
MSDQTLLAAFFVALGATVVVLAAALVLAHRHQARGHIGAVVGFLALLLVTLVFAEMLGRRFDFEPTPQRIHLTLAFLTAGVALLPLATGIAHWRGRLSRDTHKRIAMVFLGLVVAAVGTGFWMLSGRTPARTSGLPAPAAPAGEA